MLAGAVRDGIIVRNSRPVSTRCEQAHRGHWQPWHAQHGTYGRCRRAPPAQRLSACQRASCASCRDGPCAQRTDGDFRGDRNMSSSASTIFPLATKRSSVFVPHELADAMRHKPGRLVGHVEHAMELATAHALLRGAEQVGWSATLLSGILERSSAVAGRRDGELLHRRHACTGTPGRCALPLRAVAPKNRNENTPDLGANARRLLRLLCHKTKTAAGASQQPSSKGVCEANADCGNRVGDVVGAGEPRGR